VNNGIFKFFTEFHGGILAYITHTPLIQLHPNEKIRETIRSCTQKKDEVMSMFCYQCEMSTPNGCRSTGAVVGTCGKDENLARLQDSMIFGLKGLSAYREHLNEIEPTQTKAIDDLGEFTERFTLQELTASMNNFGKALIADHPTPPLLAPVGIFRGTLGGKYPITVFIQTINDDGSLTGFYWYDKQQKPLTLGGTYHNALMSLQADKETFTLTYTNNTLNGAWQQGKNTPLEVKLTQ